MSQAVDILYITFNISKRLKNNTVRSWVVYILLACVKHVHARILPLRAKVCTRRTILTPPPFVKVRLPSKCVIVYLRVRGIIVASLYNFPIELWNCSNSVVCFIFHFIPILRNCEQWQYAKEHTMQRPK